MTRRGQLVLLTGAIVAIAFLPVLVAVLHTGASPTPQPTGTPFLDTETALDSRIAQVPTLATDYDWDRRRAASRIVRDHLAPTLEGLRSPTADGIRTTEFAAALAKTFAARSCPTGPNQRFGDCQAFDGVVLQERAGATHLVAVAVRVSITGSHGRRGVTLVIRAPTRLTAEPTA